MRYWSRSATGRLSTGVASALVGVVGDWSVVEDVEDKVGMERSDGFLGGEEFVEMRAEEEEGEMDG